MGGSGLAQLGRLQFAFQGIHLSGQFFLNDNISQAQMNWNHRPFGCHGGRDCQHYAKHGLANLESIHGSGGDIDQVVGAVAAGQTGHGDSPLTAPNKNKARRCMRAHRLGTPATLTRVLADRRQREAVLRVTHHWRSIPDYCSI